MSGLATRIAPELPCTACPNRQIHDTQHDFAAGLQCDQVGPQRIAAQVIARAVDGVDDPAPSAAGFTPRAFLAQDAVVGKRGCQDFRNQPLAFTVGRGDRGVVGFCVGRNARLHPLRGFHRGAGCLEGHVKFSHVLSVSLRLARRQAQATWRERGGLLAKL